MRAVSYFIGFMLIVTVQQSIFGQTERGDKLTLTNPSEFKKNSLKDVSHDGKFLLLFQTNAPIRIFTSTSDGTTKAPKFDNFNDVLRVVERATGREIGRLATNGFPSEPRFLPGTRHVFFGDQDKDPTVPTRIQKLWDADTGKVSTCMDTKNFPLRSGESGFSILAPVSENSALGKIWQRDGDNILVKVSLPSCEVARIGTLSIADPQIRRGAGDMSISTSRNHIAFGTREGVLIVRKVDDLSVVAEIQNPSGLILGEMPLYTSDGKFLLIAASTTITDRRETKKYLLFFETANYRLTRQLEITGWMPPQTEQGSYPSNYVGSAMSISPDDRILAIASKVGRGAGSSKNEQAEILLYDLRSGKEVAKRSHGSVQTTRSDPFVAQINRLIFTPDGKYLISSTHDTIVWEIAGKN